MLCQLAQIALTHTRFALLLMPPCGGKQALYTLMDNNNTDPLALNFPLHRVYVALGVNQPLVGRCAFRSEAGCGVPIRREDN